MDPRFCVYFLPMIPFCLVRHRLKGQMQLVFGLLSVQHSDDPERYLDLIRSTFPDEVANQILQIPLPKKRKEDVLVWRRDPFGEFTIKITYKLLHEGTFRPNYTNYAPKDLYMKL
ncbi:hypothetical protein J1N35_013707 [Gossypium stocksii]|uniref:Uncharacterized protein n=1 Tax=Gossypium stocksii TaxID=47602 RepID=A0A9D4A931_9ROSI|nr:hypothetical protein J1N35_013707 [Gossypium stocksii]